MYLIITKIGILSNFNNHFILSCKYYLQFLFFWL